MVRFSVFGGYQVAIDGYGYLTQGCATLALFVACGSSDRLDLDGWIR